MSTTFGEIKSTRYENVVEIYTSNGVVLWTRSEKSSYGEKMVLDETNIEEFLLVLSAALSYYNLHLDYNIRSKEMPNKDSQEIWPISREERFTWSDPNARAKEAEAILEMLNENKSKEESDDEDED